MATTETTTPPERCPVCGWVEDYRKTDESRVTDVYYNCGAHWVRYTHGKSDWVDHCPHAMTAALRCGATLEPTPLETARQALVDAAVVWATSVITDETTEPDPDMQLYKAATAYRALLEPKP